MLRKYVLRFLKSKPRRSLCRLRLKFVQTSAEVSRKYYVLTNLSTRTHHRKYVYSLKRVRCTHFSQHIVLVNCPQSQSWLVC